MVLEGSRLQKRVTHHYGAFVIKPSLVSDYLATSKPQVLRWSSSMGRAYLSPDLACHTFGSSKGLGFDHVRIISPEIHLKYLGGNLKVFGNDKTEESRNKMYVAITRARYSLAFVVEQEHLANIKLPHWDRLVQVDADAERIL